MNWQPFMNSVYGVQQVIGCETSNGNNNNNNCPMKRGNNTVQTTDI